MAETVKFTVDDSKLQRLIAEVAAQGQPIRIIADGVHYGIYQEFGTVRMGAQPFMGPALRKHKETLVKALKAAGDDFGKTEDVVEKVARLIEGTAKDLAPVDTGTLKNSIHVVSGDEFGFEVDIDG